jgi:CheY-like chemotaxis protein
MGSVEPPRRNPEPGKQALGRADILVVEDEFLLRMFLVEELRAQGYSVIEAINAEEALDLLDQGLRIDLLLTDIRMPGAFDGAELVRRVRARYPHIMVAVASAHRPERELGDKVDDFFPKPYDIPRLARQVKAILG